MGPLRDGVVDSDTLAIYLEPVALLLCYLRVIRAGKVDKGKPTGTTCLNISQTKQ